MRIPGQELSPDQLRTFRDRLQSDIIPKHLDIILQYGELHHAAVFVDGDLTIDSDFDLDEEKVQVLIVGGDLKVNGRLRDRHDEEIESLILVTGNLETTDLFTGGSLEVHGDVVVRDNLLLRDNACIAHIGGSLEATFALNQYHHCHVGGEVRIETLIQDASRIECKVPPEFIELDGCAVAGVLHRDLLEGMEDEDEEFGFYVDCVDVQALSEWIYEGKSIFRQS